MWRASQIRKLYVSIRRSARTVYTKTFKETLVTLYTKTFKENLVVANTAFYVSMFTLADGIIQVMEQAGNDKFEYDFKRTGKMIVFASLFGPPSYYWYVGLDRFIVQGTLRNIVLKKILADQFVFAPIFYVSFFGICGKCEQKSVRQISTEFKEKIVSLYLTDWTVWPAAQAINFFFIPSRFRVVYVSTMYFLWDIFLSYVKHREFSTQPHVPAHVPTPITHIPPLTPVPALAHAPAPVHIPAPTSKVVDVLYCTNR